ncbi:Alpha-crystallin B chain [Frankliniella fusca]|uniref:Alpha-crystallin B chain n=1 Tax=Frankliniella fusca TaxID=407009 RepID=A0AAE1HTB9_9NEOP|nr:Alpha-crystallin B chain [Frankliniella fusca]
MSVLPIILGELHDLGQLSAALDNRRYGPGWGRDDYGLLDDLVTYRDNVHPVLRLLDLDVPERAPAHHHHILLRPQPRHVLQRQPSAPSRRRTLLQHLQQQAREAKEVAKKDDGLLINVDVQQFRPEELSVQVLKDQRCVVVEGKHEERADEHGYVRRQFTRRYMLPDYVDPETISSKLTSDGVLQVFAPRKEALPAPKENVRHVTITHTERPAVEDTPDEAAAGENKKEEAVADKNKPGEGSNVDNGAVVDGA